MTGDKNTEKPKSDQKWKYGNTSLQTPLPPITLKFGTREYTYGILFGVKFQHNFYIIAHFTAKIDEKNIFNKIWNSGAFIQTPAFADQD